VKLTSGTLAVFSPVALTPAVEQRINELGGQVRYLIAPDIAHHIFISDWARKYPEAKIIGPEGLPEKRAKDKDEKIGNEEFAVVFKAKTKRSTTVDADFDRDFSYEFVDGHANKELAFLYKPDKVLIEADLIFNLPAIEQYSRVPEKERAHGVPGRLFNSVQSTKGDAKGMKRLIWYALSAGNRPSFNDSVALIDKWDFDTIIPCHGEVMQGDGKQIFEKIFEWHLNAAQAQHKS
jgi:glyoxylase-like metal-dependent hydrolase (beta-lactamase superfamily II)